VVYFKSETQHKSSASNFTNEANIKCGISSAHSVRHL